MQAQGRGSWPVQSKGQRRLVSEISSRTSFSSTHHTDLAVVALTAHAKRSHKLDGVFARATLAIEQNRIEGAAWDQEEEEGKRIRAIRTASKQHKTKHHSRIFSNHSRNNNDYDDGSARHKHEPRCHLRLV